MRFVRPWTRDDRVDVLLGTGAVALGISLVLTMPDPMLPNPMVAGILAVIHALPVAARRRYPLPAFAVSGFSGLIYLALGNNTVGLGVAALIMIYSIGTEIPRSQSRWILVATEAGVVGAVLIGGQPMDRSTIVGNAIVLAAAWALGDSVRRRQLAAAAERDALARQAVSEERLRLARELHDIVAHSMSVVSVQAGTARLLLEDEPDRARAAITAIEAASGQAMDEMRRLLDVLRSSDEPAALVPMPGLADIDTLVADAVAGGTPVKLEVLGDRKVVSPGVELAAYRVIQEGLTNVRKHAPGATAHVRVTYDDQTLTIDVDNDGGRPGQVEGGYGLTGMRERIALYDGEMLTERTPDGVFHLHVRIPHEVAAS